MSRKGVFVALFGLILATAGCASFASVRTGEVEVPIAVPCRVPDVARPVFAIDTLPADADVFAVARALWASIEEYEAYDIELEAAIAACR